MTLLTDEAQSLTGVIHDLGQTLSEGHIDDDATATFRHDKWRILGQLGLFGLACPTEHGGGGQDLPTTVAALRALGEANRDSGLSFSATTQMASTATPLARFGSSHLQERYLPAVADGTLIGAHAITEPTGGSDALKMRTTAVREGATYRLNGSKAFVSNGPIADVIVVYARTGQSALGGISTFLVPTDTPGVHRGQPVSKMGLRTSPLCEVYFDDVTIGQDHLLGREGLGFRILDYVMKREILYSFAVSLGEMKHRLERTIAYANQRQQFGAPLAANQAISHRIVDMSLAHDTGALWIEHTAARAQAGKDIAKDLAATKLHISQSAVDSAHGALHIFGGYGYMSEYGLEKDLRSAIPGTIYSGSSEIQRDRIAALLGLRTTS